MKGERHPAGVVIVNYNGERFLDACLASVFSQSYRPRCVVVVDNASSDHSVALIRERYPEVVLIGNVNNLGLGVALNQGIRAARSNCHYVAILNADVRASPDWLSEGIETLERHPEGVACASFVIERDGRTVESAGGEIRSLPGGVFGGVAGGASVEKFHRDRGCAEFPVFFALVTAMVARVSAFERYGYFDERYFLYFEDIDWSWRCIVHGADILCNPRSIVHHHGYGSTKSPELKLYIAGACETNLLATCHKNLSPAAQLLLLPLLVPLRIAFACLYFPTSRRLTASKLLGIARFFRQLLCGAYGPDRRWVNSRRSRSDLNVLRLKSGYGLGTVKLFRLGLSWYKQMRTIHG